MDDTEATVCTTRSDAAKLALATACLGVFNFEVAKFLLADPFGVGVEDLAVELENLRDGGTWAIHEATRALGAEVPDLQPVAQAAVDTAGGALFLVLRCGELVRRSGVGPEAAAEVRRLEVAVDRVIRMVLGIRLSDPEKIEKIQAETMDWEEALAASRREGVQLGEASVLKRLIERRWGDLPAWAGERLGKTSREELESWTDRLADRPSELQCDARGPGRRPCFIASSATSCPAGRPSIAPAWRRSRRQRAPCRCRRRAACSWRPTPRRTPRCRAGRSSTPAVSRPSVRCGWRWGR